MNEKESACSCFGENGEREEKEAIQGGVGSKKEKPRIRPTKAMGGAKWEQHGMTKTAPEYKVWRNMRYRCNCPSSKEYQYYGGRGISVCKRWDSFLDFMVDMGPRPGIGYSIDRKNNNKGYCPHNCRWATYIEQNNNTRFNKRHGEFTTAELARIHNLSWACASKRLKRGIPLTLPVGVSKHYLRSK